MRGQRGAYRGTQPCGTRRRLALAAASALVIAGLVGAEAHAAPPLPGQVSFTASTLFPKFATEHRGLRRPLQQPAGDGQGHTANGWEAAIGDHPFRSGDFSEVVPLSAGRAFRIFVRELGSSELHRYFVRCLPNSFPNYTYTRYSPASPRFFSVDRAFDQQLRALRDHLRQPRGAHLVESHSRLGHQGAFEREPPLARRDLSPGRWATYRLDGSLVRTFYGVGRGGDAHDLQFQPNGNHLIGAYVRQGNVDTSAWGGSRDATVINTELQEVRPDHTLAWSWKSQQHIGRAETGRHWPRVIRSRPYDILHWNSIEPAGTR